MREMLARRAGKPVFNGDPARLQVDLIFTKPETNTKRTRRANTEHSLLVDTPVTFCYCCKVKEKRELFAFSVQRVLATPFSIVEIIYGISSEIVCSI